MSKITRFFWNWTLAFKKFPVAHLSLLALSVYLCSLIATETEPKATLFSAVLVFLLALFGPLFCLHATWAEKKRFKWFDWGSQIFAVLAWIGYYFILDKAGENIVHAQGLTLFGILGLLFVGVFVFQAWRFRSHENKIWFSWSGIVQSVIFGVLAGLIVWGGLSGALGSVQALFDVDVSYKRYSYFWAFSMVMLAGSFMLNHYIFSTLELPNEANKAIEIPLSRTRTIFWSYIFLPLALIYLLIFLAYGVKILMTGIWPNGIIVWLGVGYFALGMMTFYFTFPEKSPFFEYIRKILFVSFLLIVMMMVGAIWQRIAQYGITMNRYFICALILAISIFSLCALLFPKRRLSLFAWVFLIVWALSLYGPFNARNVSFNSQKLRIESLLLKENLALPLGSGALKNLTGDVHDQLLYPLNSWREGGLWTFITTYPLQDWKTTLLQPDFIFTGGGTWGLKQAVYSYLEIKEKVYYPESKENDNYFNYYARQSLEQEGIWVQWYSMFYMLKNDDTVKDNVFVYRIDGRDQFLDLNPYLEDIYAKAKSQEAHDAFTIEDGERVFIFTDIYWEKQENWIKILSLYGYLLVK